MESRTAAIAMPASQRRALIATGVVLLHVGALWALQSGLMRRAVEIIVPGEILSEFTSPSPAPKKQPQRVQPPAAQPAPPLPAPTPAPATPEPAPAAPATLTAAPAPVAQAAIVQAPVKIELPSSDAAYLNNPKPIYPALSRRLGEQGKVVVRVLIGVDGRAQQAEIRSSSGYERLDQAALTTVRNWRYAPGTRNGAPEAMWFNAPINFVLE